MNSTGLFRRIFWLNPRVFFFLLPVLLFHSAEAADFTPFGPKGEGGAINGQDFYAEGRTLENLGLADLSIDQLNKLLHDGL